MVVVSFYNSRILLNTSMSWFDRVKLLLHVFFLIKKRFHVVFDLHIIRTLLHTLRHQSQMTWFDRFRSYKTSQEPIGVTTPPQLLIFYFRYVELFLLETLVGLSIRVTVVNLPCVQDETTFFNHLGSCWPPSMSLPSLSSNTFKQLIRTSRGALSYGTFYYSLEGKEFSQDIFGLPVSSPWNIFSEEDTVLPINSL